MAYRRSLTTRAKFLYQQKGATPAISYTHDDDRKTHDLPSCENPRVSSFFQPRYARSEINSFNGSKNLFQNRRFFPSRLMIPMNSGSMFTRSMSSSVGGGAEKIEYISEVAELADKAVEAVASQVPAVNEVANAAADSYLPVKALQYLIDYVHIFTGFDWWASIIATTIVIRCITLPLMINQLKATTKFAGMAPAAVAEGQQRMQAAMKEHGVTPFTPLKGILIQGPVFVSFFMAISNMVEKVPSFKQGGVLWFTDLTVTDSMYIFPVLTALTFWITVECNAQEGLEGNPSAKTIKNVSRAFAALTIPFTAGFPKAVFCYWMTSNLFSLSYGLLVKRPAVKKFLGVPIIPVTPKSEQKPALPFFETLKKYAAAHKQIAEQQHMQSSSAVASEPTKESEMAEKFIIEVEPAKPAKDGKPSVGPVYRSKFAKDGFPPPIEGLNSCWDIFRLSVEKYPNNRMLGHRKIVDGKPGKYVWKTYKEVYDIVIKVGNSIRNCGVEKGGKCGIFGANCAEWIISMEACNAHGLYCVPLYDTLGAGAVEFIISHAEVAIAFVEEKKVPELLKTFPNAAKYLKIFMHDGFPNLGLSEYQHIKSFCSVLKMCSFGNRLDSKGSKNQYDLPLKEKTDICTIMYTSGTTGEPKGVMISNNSIVTLIAGVKRFLESLTMSDVYLSYLPLAHIFDRAIEECFIRHGASIGFWRGDVKLLTEDLGELKPTVFCAVPRVRDGLGGKVRLILSGAAPLSSHVEAFLRVVACAHVLQGYGLTETCAGTFVSLPNQFDMLGTVGPPVPNVDVCLVSVPEMEYDALSSTPRGEICVRGDTLFSGYYKREDLTKEVLIDGWFHTGDIGEWQPNGSLKIIDRMKNIFKLSQGEYVAVENLENVFGNNPVIESVWVYGSSFESFLVAVVNPSKQQVEKWAKQNSLSGDFNSLCENSKVKEHILGELTKVGKEKKLKGFEFIKALHLDPVPFDMERDLLTPTFKKKRPQLLKYYKDVIDTMYKDAK
uniref:Long-chain-fatty-acid--CoA ligase n=1 Tax=Solanum lycopersicum TaxID=4081 RepID=A0A3Q7IF77_SOLLC